ncbi:DUF1772 domain-containing protein [filamentous cyanobacterium CCP1]|nr:DUF1772 domain-containing protein [filamentous cyanobacterium CCP2]PSB62884.1 DUF1772 domain-containing protein [filamentous cyanobacterium CCP1]
MSVTTYQRQLQHKKRRKLTKAISTLLLWLFVINLGIALGAGLYETRIEIPQWLMILPESGYQWNAEAARQANTGLRFWIYVTTVPLTLLTIANMIVGWHHRGSLQRWWLSAVGAATIDRLWTFSYFVPTMIKLMDGTLPEPEAVSIALQWVNLNHFRHIVVLVAWLAALKAFSLHGRGTQHNQVQ